MAFEIRAAGSEEVVAAVALWSRVESFRTGVAESDDETAQLLDAIVRATADGRGRLLVGVDDGELVATIYGVQLRDDPMAGQVAMLAVEPARWSRGIGSAMLQALTDSLTDAGCRRLRMNVDPANDRARALYERSGWTNYGETERISATTVELVYRTSFVDVAHDEEHRAED